VNTGELRELWTVQFIEALQASHHSDWSAATIAEAASVCADRLVATITAVAYKQPDGDLPPPPVKEERTGYM
jgi:hypothetical protein